MSWKIRHGTCKERYAKEIIDSQVFQPCSLNGIGYPRAIQLTECMRPASLFCSALKTILSLPKTLVNASFVLEETEAKLEKTF
jgi:hypothetical protein